MREIKRRIEEKLTRTSLWQAGFPWCPKTLRALLLAGPFHLDSQSDWMYPQPMTKLERGALLSAWIWSATMLVLHL